MKVLINNYQFNAAAKTITLPSYAGLVAANFLLITNTTADVIIYNFAALTKGGTVSGNVLTLTYDTTAMANSDQLQIYYDDPALTASTREEQLVMHDLLENQITILMQLNALTNALNGAALNVIAATGSTTAVSSLPTLASVTTVAGVTTVSTVTNLSQIGAVNAAEYLFNNSQIAAVQANTANIFYS
jgi:hypothetical protein